MRQLQPLIFCLAEIEQENVRLSSKKRLECKTKDAKAALMHAAFLCWMDADKFQAGFNTINWPHRFRIPCRPIPRHRMEYSSSHVKVAPCQLSQCLRVWRDQ